MFPFLRIMMKDLYKNVEKVQKQESVEISKVSLQGTDKHSKKIKIINNSP